MAKWCSPFGQWCFRWFLLIYEAYTVSITFNGADTVYCLISKAENVVFFFFWKLPSPQKTIDKVIHSYVLYRSSSETVQNLSSFTLLELQYYCEPVQTSLWHDCLPYKLNTFSSLEYLSPKTSMIRVNC